MMRRLVSFLPLLAVTACGSHPPIKWTCVYPQTSERLEFVETGRRGSTILSAPTLRSRRLGSARKATFQLSSGWICTGVYGR